jgi:hypothetical protein
VRASHGGRRDGSARIVPVIAKPVFWKKRPLPSYQALPEDGRTISTCPDRGEAYVQVVEGIYDLVGSL